MGFYGGENVLSTTIPCASLENHAALQCESTAMFAPMEHVHDGQNLQSHGIPPHDRVPQKSSRPMTLQFLQPN